MNRINKETLVRKLAEGVSQSKIAREMNVSRAAVCKMVRKLESRKTQHLFSELVDEFASKDAFGLRVKFLLSVKMQILGTWARQLEEFDKLMDAADNERDIVKSCTLICRIARSQWKVLDQITRKRSLIYAIEDLEHLIKLMFLVLDQLAARDHKEFRELLRFAQRYGEIKKERYERGWSLGWR